MRHARADVPLEIPYSRLSVGGGAGRMIARDAAHARDQGNQADMNRDETLALYDKGRDAWNAWAEKLLAKKAALEKVGEWETKREAWDQDARAEFSSKAVPHTFLPELNLNEFKFPGAASFDNATFANDADFFGAIFDSNATFVGATFKGDAGFGGAMFANDADFFGAVFEQHANFYVATFAKDATFNAAMFHGVAGFGDANFEGDMRVRGATFKKEAEFFGATFKGETIFKGGKFGADARFDGATYSGGVTFSDAEFIGRAWFDAIHSERAFSLAEATFHKLPDFIQAHFAEAPRLDDVRLPTRLVEPGRFWSSISAPGDADANARYRALRRLAELGKDHPHELQFWAGELRASRSLRGRNKNGWHNGWRVLFPSWWANILYEGVSDFGRSFMRPLYLSAVALGTMTWLHINAHMARAAEMGRSYDFSLWDWSCSLWTDLLSGQRFTGEPAARALQGIGDGDCNPLFAAKHLALQSAIPIFGSNSSPKVVQDYICLYGFNDSLKLQGAQTLAELPEIPDSIVMLQSVHTLVSAILIFLFLLAVRNTFKIS